MAVRLRLFSLTLALLFVMLAPGIHRLRADDKPATQPENRLPVPDAAAQTTAEKKVRDAFGTHEKEAPETRAGAASRMLDAAATTQDEPATLYVLLKKSGELAAGAGDGELALKTAAKLGEQFAVDTDELSAQLLHKASLASLTPLMAQKLVEASVAYANKLTANQKYDLALHVLASAEIAARSARDNSLRFTVQSATSDIKAIQNDSTRGRSAEAKLAKTPDDADANYLFGRYQCLSLDNWPAGLPALAKGSNAAFHQAAVADLANPQTSTEQVAAGDRWWDLGEKETGKSRTGLQRRAILWYDKAQQDPKLNGVARIKLQKRSQPTVAVAPPEIPKPVAVDPPHARNRKVIYFNGSGREVAVFKLISGGAIVVAPKPATFLADPGSPLRAGIVVLGNDCFQDAAAADLNDRVAGRLRNFVGDGGDLVVFEQQSVDARALIEKTFKITVELKDSRRLTPIPPDLAGAVQASGVAKDANRDSVNSSNLYTVPANAIVFYRGGDGGADDPVVAASVPFGRGRVILIGNNMETSEAPWDEQLLDYLYHYKPGGRKP